MTGISKIGLQTHIGLGSSSGSNWTPQYWVQQSEVYELWKITGAGNLVGLKRGDTLTVGGSVGSYTFQVPNTTPYQTYDTDYIWFRTDLSQRTTSELELTSYDLQKTPVKYLDNSPNSIEYIMILNSSVTGTKRDKMFHDFHLPIMWDDSWNDYGQSKSNRPIEEQILWTVESVIVPEPSSALVAQATQTYAEITFDNTLDDSFVPATSAFSVLVDSVSRTVSNVAVSGTKVTLTVTPTFEYGDVITIDYTKPVSNYLRASGNGNAVASFSTFAVTNNITSPVILADTNTFDEYVHNLGVTKNGSDNVTALASQISGGHNLTQDWSPSRLPHWTADELYFNENEYDSLFSSAFTQAQPLTIYAIIKLPSVTGTATVLRCGSVYLMTYFSKLALYAGGANDLTTFCDTCSLNTYHLVKVHVNGASSSLQIDSRTKLTGTSGNSNGGKISLGGDADGGAFRSQYFKHSIFRKVDDTSTNDAIISKYLTRKYGL
jgi:uncharacterized repeat protein (TIGR02059 family)